MYQIQKLDSRPIIDGSLDDDAWQKIAVADSFYMYTPSNGILSPGKTRVRLAYDDNAIYIGAMIFDHPDSIRNSLSARDVYSGDYDKFGVQLLPYNDGINGYEYWVTAAGVQMDIKKTGDRSDVTWNEVWESEVTMMDSGWIAEMRIPFATLRFPKKAKQTWGLNILRYTKREASLSTWNFVNRQLSGFITQGGLVTGLDDIKPPLRLSFTPYFSSYIENTTGRGNTIAYRGGLDFKYGINESFTLDMMLVPDFGQVQSDDVVLNLSPFEIEYSEKRQFFKEGSELFDKAGIFYSKRIGGEPVYFDQVEDQLQNPEKIIENPGTAQLINASKFTGRTDNGTGVGVLNAMSNTTYAKIRDTISGKERLVLTQPLTNYNVSVVDKSLKNNSYVSFINTNYYNTDLVANVLASDFNLKNKENTYGINGLGAISYRNPAMESDLAGHRYYLKLAKISGNFRGHVSRSLRSNNYEINDLGFMRLNNIVYNRLQFYLRSYKSFWNVRKTNYKLEFSNDQMYRVNNERGKFASFYTDFNFFAEFNNYADFRMYAKVMPLEAHDYYEPRVEGRVFKDRPYYYLYSRYSTDERKANRFAVTVAGWKTFSNDAFGRSISGGPGISFSKKIKLHYWMKIGDGKNGWGYVAKTVGNDTIYFGSRNTRTVENRINTAITFNKNTTLNFRLRHYWSEVKYKDYFILDKNGYLEDTDYNENHDINYNTFSVDMIFSWRFAPGSEMSIAWKNNILSDQDDVFYHDYFNNFWYTIGADQTNTFSIRVLYYIDYLTIKNSFKR